MLKQCEELKEMVIGLEEWVKLRVEVVKLEDEQIETK